MHISMNSISVGALIALLTVLIGGCGTSAQKHLDSHNQEELQEFTGWLRLRGEFLLYETKTLSESGIASNCISGSLPLGQQLSATRFEGKKVRIWARPVIWRLPSDDAVSLNYAGSPIVNWCKADTVLFASRIELLE